MDVKMGMWMWMRIRNGNGGDRCGVWQFREWKEPNGFRKRSAFSVNSSGNRSSFDVYLQEKLGIKNYKI